MMKQKFFLWLMFLTVIMIFSSATVYSGTIDLPKTGQTECYDVNGNLRTCPGTGEDGDILSGVDWTASRFAADATGNCVTDSLTGLMWTEDANLAPGSNWDQSLTYANALDLCGFTDWRLPNVNELESLIHYGTSNPATWLNSNGFINVQNAPYWASTTYFSYTPSTAAYAAKEAWVVDISKAGALTGGYYLSASDAGIPLKTDTTPYVWPVRGGVTE